MELLRNMPDDPGAIFLYDGYTSLLWMHHRKCSDGAEAICQLLQRDPNLTKQKIEIRYFAFHDWAYDGEVGPFECILKSNNIIHDVRRVFVVFTQTNHYRHHPLQIWVIYTPLSLAVASANKKFAYMLSIDDNTLIKCRKSVLFLIYREGMLRSCRKDFGDSI